MRDIDLLQDKDFLLKLDNERNRRIYVKITVLTMDEIPIRDIEGQVIMGGSINIDGNSSMRRTANISFVAKKIDNQFEDVEDLLTINKKVKLSIGMENKIDEHYDDVIWFNQGIYIVTSISFSHSTSGISISLNLKDKMCLLNGEVAGNLPTAVDFSQSYDYSQMDENGRPAHVQNLFYDIIKTGVIEFGKERIDNLLIQDMPLEIKQIVRWTGTRELYFTPLNSIYSFSKPEDNKPYEVFGYNDEIGYVFTRHIYPKEKELKTSINANIANDVLNNILKYYANHEYYYDVDGRFVFREKKNYLNGSYDPTISTRLDNIDKVSTMSNNSLSILDNTNYQVDFTQNNKYSYVFSENNSIVTSYSNTPDYANIKNDFHVWGLRNGISIHYHLVLKRKPRVFETYNVVYLTETIGGETKYTGKLRLATQEEIDGQLSEQYTPEDWRAQLYMEGLDLWQKQIRPDSYQQEILDKFDDIYNMKEKQFKVDIVHKRNDLNYFIDYLEPTGKLQEYSVDNIGARVIVTQSDSINKLYNRDIPNFCLIDNSLDDDEKEKQRAKIGMVGSYWANVDKEIYDGIAEELLGGSAQDYARNLLNDYTTYNETINIQCMPIYYLEPNTRIRVEDSVSNIHGDYVIKTISLPIGSGQMNISAVRIRGLAETMN